MLDLDVFDIHDFFRAVISQDADKLSSFFEPDARIFWANTNEMFTVNEYVRANCEYPGEWRGKIEDYDFVGNKWGDKKLIYTAIVRDGEGSTSRTLSFIDFGDTEEELIHRMIENWCDVGEPPQWRKDMRIGTRYRDEEF